MHVGIRARRMYWTNRLLHFTPVLSGERALRREIWDQVPRDYKRNFQIEIALNFFAKQNGHRMGISILRGLNQVIKERKRGLLAGLWQRILMIRDILLASWRIYVLLQAWMLVERLLRHRNDRSRLTRATSGLDRVRREPAELQRVHLVDDRRKRIELVRRVAAHAVRRDRASSRRPSPRAQT